MRRARSTTWERAASRRTFIFSTRPGGVVAGYDSASSSRLPPHAIKRRRRRMHMKTSVGFRDVHVDGAYLAARDKGGKTFRNELKSCKRFRRTVGLPAKRV